MIEFKKKIFGVKLHRLDPGLTTVTHMYWYLCIMHTQKAYIQYSYPGDICAEKCRWNYAETLNTQHF